MQKVFWDDPYQTTLETHVVSVNKNEVLFDKTIIYSFAGGQESDKAWVKRVDSVHKSVDNTGENREKYEQAGEQKSEQVKECINEQDCGFEILGSRLLGNEIYYMLPNNHELVAGQKVLMIIDWRRRYKLMRLHFAAELVLELVTRFLPSAQKVGAHIAEHKARIDFACGTNISEVFPELLREYNKIIEQDLLIEKEYSDRAIGRRYWKITGFAQVPCGGTHVRSTGEVGFITCKRDRPGKGIERIEIRLVNP